MKKVLLFSILFVGLFGFTTSSMASTITLPNPLCLNPPTGNTNCDNGAWSPVYASLGACYAAYGDYSCVDSFPLLINKIITYISNIIGALAVLMFVISGIYFVASGGNPEKANKAKQIAIYAAVGLGIALAGRGLVEVVQEVIIGQPPST